MKTSRILPALAALGVGLLPALFVSPAGAADSPSTAATAAPTAETPATPDRGVWQKHELSFVFLGFTSTYSCDGLADKVKLLLIAAGARADAKSRPGACASGFGRPDKFARADLKFYTLAPDSNVKASDGPRVEGAWRPVTLTARSPRELGTGDCELIEQFRDTVLPLFATRNLENHTTCIPHQESGSVIDLKFDAFAALPNNSKPVAQLLSR
jgi:hypothetical protein